MGRGFESLRAHYLLYKVGIAVLHGSLYARNVYNVVFPMEIFHMVGIAQLVSAPDCGSGGQGFESLYPPCCDSTIHKDIGLSPSGKAQDFDSCIRWFESN